MSKLEQIAEVTRMARRANTAKKSKIARMSIMASLAKVAGLAKMASLAKLAKMAKKVLVAKNGKIAIFVEMAELGEIATVAKNDAIAEVAMIVKVTDFNKVAEFSTKYSVCPWSRAYPFTALGLKIFKQLFTERFCEYWESFKTNFLCVRFVFLGKHWSKTKQCNCASCLKIFVRTSKEKLSQKSYKNEFEHRQKNKKLRVSAFPAFH